MSDRQLTPLQAEAFQRAHVVADHLVIWCVTHNTEDFGGRFVARPIVVPNERPNRDDGFLIADSLEGLRDLLPAGLSWLDRNPADDPVIVETWV